MELNLDTEVLMMDFNAQAENELLDNNRMESPRLPEVLSKLDFILRYFDTHTELVHYCHSSKRDMTHADILSYFPCHDELMQKARAHLRDYHRETLIEWERELV